MKRSEIEARIAEVEKVLGDLKMQLNALEEKTGWEKPERGQVYWYILRDGWLSNFNWDGGSEDSEQYTCGNCFTSKELAENIARYQSLDLRIRREIAEICEPVKYTEAYFGIVYCCDEIVPVAYNQMVSTPWRCDTKEHAKQIIEEFKDELTWYFTEFKDRMDG